MMKRKIPRPLRHRIRMISLLEITVTWLGQEGVVWSQFLFAVEAGKRSAKLDIATARLTVRRRMDVTADVIKRNIEISQSFLVNQSLSQLGASLQSDTLLRRYAALRAKMSCSFTPST